MLVIFAILVEIGPRDVTQDSTAGAGDTLIGLYAVLCGLEVNLKHLKFGGSSYANLSLETRTTRGIKKDRMSGAHTVLYLVQAITSSDSSTLRKILNWLSCSLLMIK